MVKGKKPKKSKEPKQPKKQPEKAKEEKPEKPKGKQIGVVTNYFDHVKVAAINLSAPLKVGDKIEIKGGEVDVEQEIGSMQIQHEKVEKAKKGDEIGIKVKEKVRKGYKVYKK